MPSAALAAMQHFYEAEELYSSAGQKNFAQIAATIHPEIVLFQPDSLPYGGEWHGHQGFEDWTQAFTRAWLYVRPRDAQVIACSDDTIVSLVTMEAQARASHKQVRMPMCQIVRMRDNLPVEWRNFAWDTAVLNDALADPQATV